MFLRISALLLCAVASCAAIDQNSYRQDDFVTYRCFRYVRCLDAGTRNAYAGTTEGLLVYDLWKKQWALPLTTADGLPGREVLAVKAADDQNLVWIKTSGGICYYDLGLSRVVVDSWRHPFDTLMPPPRPSLGNLFVAQPYFFDGRDIKDRAFHAAGVSIAVITGRDDLIVGTLGNGAGFGSRRMGQVEMAPIGLWENDASALYFDGTRMWFGTTYGISTQEVATNRWEYIHCADYSAFADSHILCITGTAGYVYVGTGRGLVRFDRKHGVWDTFLYSNLGTHAIRTVVPENGERLWIGTDAGLCSYETSTGAFSWHASETDSRPDILCLCLGKNGLWIGTGMGLYFGSFRDTLSSTGKTALGPVQVRGVTWKHMSSHYYLANRPVYALVADDSLLWAGCEDGLVKVRMNGSAAEAYGDIKSPVGGPVYAISSIGPYLWLGTNRGMLAARKNSVHAVEFREEDGLAGARVLVLEKQGEYIWAGTNNGATRVRREAVLRTKGFAGEQ